MTIADPTGQPAAAAVLAAKRRVTAPRPAARRPDRCGGARACRHDLVEPARFPGRCGRLRRALSFSASRGDGRPVAARGGRRPYPGQGTALRPARACRRRDGDARGGARRGGPHPAGRRDPAARSRAGRGCSSSPTPSPRPCRSAATSARSTPCSMSSSRSPGGSLSGAAHSRNRRSMLKLIGQTLLVQHRVSGRVARSRKSPTCYGIVPTSSASTPASRTNTSSRSAPARSSESWTSSPRPRGRSPTSIDADRSTRLEMVVVLLILAEILLTHRADRLLAALARVGRRNRRRQAPVEWSYRPLVGGLHD